MSNLLCGAPLAQTTIEGSPAFPSIRGNVFFYQADKGSMVLAEIRGIPKDLIAESGGFLGFHIHEGKTCTGNTSDPFADVGGHYNPTKQPHPRHAGDLPPLLCGNGIAWTYFYTPRFTPQAVIGKTIIIHHMPDNFTSQPSGNSGIKIACGEIIAAQNIFIRDR